LVACAGTPTCRATAPWVYGSDLQAAFSTRWAARSGSSLRVNHGLDSQKSVKAMHDGRAKAFVSLGGNFLLALPDTAYTAEALSRTNLTVRIGTKLNRSDLVTGRQALILPCLGRTERDARPATTTRPMVD